MFMHCVLQTVTRPKTNQELSGILPCERGCGFIGADKTAAVGESTDTGAEMTEEEWNLRVAELNKHQVGFA